MKPSPGRLDIASYPRRRLVPIRFSDVDMFRHLNNVATGQFYEEGRFELLADARRGLGKDERGALVIANVNTSFLGQARYPGEIEVGTGVVSLSAQSLVIGQGLFVEGRCIGIADSVVVSVGEAGAVSLPEPIVRFMSALMLPVGQG